MENGRDWLSGLQEQFSAEDPAYAAAYERQKFAIALIEIRKARGMTQSEVANLMGVPQSRVGQIESKPWSVSLDRINAYAQALGARFELVLPQNTKAGAKKLLVKNTVAKREQNGSLGQRDSKSGQVRAESNPSGTLKKRASVS